MTHYLVAQIKVHDDQWIPDYAVNVLDILAKHGGKYLSRSNNITVVEGNPLDLDLLAILSFPDMQSLQSFLSDPDYAPLAKSRQAGSHSRFLAVDATDAAKVIPYLEAGQ